MQLGSRHAPDFPTWMAQQHRHPCALVRALALVVRDHGLGVVTWELHSGDASPRLLRAVRRARREYRAAMDVSYGHVGVARPPLG